MTNLITLVILILNHAPNVFVILILNHAPNVLLFETIPYKDFFGAMFEQIFYREKNYFLSH